MPDVPNSTTWCSYASECAGAIDRKYGEVNVLFVTECHIYAALRWVVRAEPFRTLFVATDLKAYVELSRSGGAYTVVPIPFREKGHSSCGITPAASVFRLSTMCSLINAMITVVEPIDLPWVFGMGLSVPAHEMKCEVPY